MPDPAARGRDNLLSSITGKNALNWSCAIRIAATFDCDDCHMRALMVPLVLLIYVAGDITLNHGASLHGWIALVSSVMRSAGLA
jgi:hypothetical protein